MGVTFDSEKKCFVFDFGHDGQNDIVSLTGSGYQIEAFGKCLYYGYEFAADVPSAVRTDFIQYVKFPESIRNDSNLTQFIQKAVNDLNSKINLYDYDLVIMPESSSRVNQYMLRYIYRFAQPTLRPMHVLANADEQLRQIIRTQNVLVIDDITTSGSTLNEVLRTLRILNDSNNITIFSLIGRKDLMADSIPN